MNKKTRNGKNDVYSPYCNEYYSKRAFYDELINKYRSLIAEVSVLKEIIAKDIELSKNWDKHTKSNKLQHQFSYLSLSKNKETLQDVINRIKEVKGFIEYKIDELKKVKTRLETIRFSTDADSKDHYADVNNNLRGDDIPYLDLNTDWEFQGTLDMAEASLNYSDSLDFAEEINLSFDPQDYNMSYEDLSEHFGFEPYKIDMTYDGYHSKPTSLLPSPDSDLEKKDN